MMTLKQATVLTLVAAGVALGSVGAAQAQDAMKKPDAMKADTMKAEPMKADAMKGDAMHADAMKKHCQKSWCNKAGLHEVGPDDAEEELTARRGWLSRQPRLPLCPKDRTSASEVFGHVPRPSRASATGGSRG